MENLKSLIDTQVDNAVEQIFANAHGVAMTTSGDISPEQQQQLDGIQEQLKKLVYNQVTQNLTQKVNIIPYDDDMGVAWKVCFGDEIQEDGFDSTADAEDWAVDNGFIVTSNSEPEKLPLKQFNVPIVRIGYSHTIIAVSARTEEEAIDIAMDEAGGEEFSEKSSEYEAPDGAMEIKNENV